MIQVQDLTKRYGKIAALKGISFSIQRGELVGLLGTNGAGKTTCLRILSCFLTPSDGQVRIAGMDPETDRRQISKMVGYLPEGVPCYPELRVEEYLRFRAKLRRIERAIFRREIDRVIEACRLADMRRRLIGQLSRGYRQRLGLAAAILGNPGILILDEPTLGMDPHQILEARQLLKSFRGSQTILLSTHILSEAEAICDRVLILNQGQLVADGPLTQLQSESSSSIFLVQVRGPVLEILAKLRNLPSVNSVDLVSESATPRFRIQAHSSLQGETIVETIVREGWALQELHQESMDLERIFCGLTSTETKESRP